MTLQHKSAREVLTMVHNNEVTRLAALSYAIEMRDSLKARNKNLRASLWVKTIDSLTSDPVPSSPEPAIAPEPAITVRHKNPPKKNLLWAWLRRKLMVA